MIILDIFKTALSPRHSQAGEELAVGITKEGNWVLLQPVEGRPKYKQLRTCADDHARQLQELSGAGKLKKTPIPGLGCDLAEWNPD